MTLSRADWTVSLLSIALALLFAPALMMHGGEIYDWANPVISDWKPDRITRDGNDLIVSGTMVKHRPCTHLAPPMARLATGQNIKVDSTSPTAGITWDRSPTPQRFGPWRVVGAAQVETTFYLRYRCHAGWDTTVEIGTIPPEGPP
jgi:hypothetical protein